MICYYSDNCINNKMKVFNNTIFNLIITKLNNSNVMYNH